MKIQKAEILDSLIFPSFNSAPVGRSTSDVWYRSDLQTLYFQGTSTDFPIPAGSSTSNLLTYWSADNTISGLSTSTYPSLTELSYVKGVTSAIQTQIDSKGSGTVTSVSGTANRITSTGGTTPVIDVSSSLWDVTPSTTKIWDGTAIASTYVGLGSVTNDAQTKASIVPNTAPAAGKILVGNAGGTAYAPVTLSGSGATMSLASTGVVTISAIANASLSNSTISGVALGSTLGALTAIDTSLTFSASYTGNAATTVGINFARANTWTGAAVFNGNSRPIDLLTSTVTDSLSSATFDAAGINMYTANGAQTQGASFGLTKAAFNAAFQGATYLPTLNMTGQKISLRDDNGGAIFVEIGGGTTASELHFLEPSGSGTNYTGFKAPALAGNVVYTLPIADGTSKQSLQTNGSAVLSWSDSQLPRSYLAGLQLSNASDTANDIQIASGTCRNSTNTTNITLAASLVKQSDAVWAVGTNAGGLDVGTVGDLTYHVYLINRSDTNVTDALYSLSNDVTATVTMTIASPAVVTWTNAHGFQAGTQIVFTTTGALPTGVTAGTTYYVISTGLTTTTFRFAATQGGAAINTSGSQSGVQTGTSTPTMPTNYDSRRRIGSIIRQASTILQFKQTGDNFILNTSVLDVNSASLGTTALTPTLSIPIGVPTEAQISAVIFKSGATPQLLVTPTNQAESCNTQRVTVRAPAAGFTVGIATRVLGDISGQIRAVASDASCSYSITTYGWTDYRGRND